MRKTKKPLPKFKVGDTVIRKEFSLDPVKAAQAMRGTVVRKITMVVNIKRPGALVRWTSGFEGRHLIVQLAKAKAAS